MGTILVFQYLHYLWISIKLIGQFCMPVSMATELKNGINIGDFDYVKDVSCLE